MTGARMPSDDGRTAGLRPRRLSGEPAGAVGPGRRGLRERGTAALAVLWASVRPTRNRATGYVAFGAVGALIGTSAVVGAGAAGALPDLADVGAWLGSSEKGTAAHANGLTGDIDGMVDLPTGDHPVSISQDGRTVLVLDKKTGEVIRIDPAQLTAEQSTKYTSSDLQLVAGGSYAYVVNPVKATVQRIDPVTTTPVGPPTDLGTAPLGQAAADPTGTLWVPQPANGTVTPFPHGRKARALPVTKAENHNLVMTLANGEPVVTDTTAGTMTMLTVKAPGVKAELPSFVRDASPEEVLVPGTTDGSVVPVLAAGSGRMALLDTRTANLTSAFLGAGGKGRYGAPQVLGSKVYVPDHANGTLKVYDTADSAIEEPVKVTEKPGELEVFVRNGLLWVNDQDNEAAAVVNTDGGVKRIGKYKTDVPGPRKPGENPPVADNVPNVPAVPDRPDPGPRDPGNGGGGGGGGDKPAPRPEPSRSRTPEPTPTPKPTPTPTPTPTAPSPRPKLPPGTPQAQAGADGITVTFSPSSGLKPERYSLPKVSGGDMAVPGMRVTPQSVGPDGPFQFHVGGLDCGQEYSFHVVAHFAGGDSMNSPLSGRVRPCTAPAAPGNLRAAPLQGGHGGTVTWQPPANASGTVTYTVSWPGGSTTTSGTSATVNNLSNGQNHTITVTSKNEAGGGAGANTALDLTPPQRTRNIRNNVNDGQPVRLRSGPGSNTAKAGEIPAGWNGAVTVHCHQTGTSEQHPSTGARSSVWARITYSGTTAWISDLWLEVAGDADVWTCQ